MDIVNIPWYQSTSGPKISLTLKALAGLLIPILTDTFGIVIINTKVDNIIDLIVFLAMGALAAYGHIRAKKSLQEELGKARFALRAMKAADR